MKCITEAGEETVSPSYLQDSVVEDIKSKYPIPLYTSALIRKF